MQEEEDYSTNFFIIVEARRRLFRMLSLFLRFEAKISSKLRSHDFDSETEQNLENLEKSSPHLHNDTKSINHTLIFECTLVVYLTRCSCSSTLQYQPGKLVQFMEYGVIE